jgi:XRE family aerobic/anaerobic benzoate catabolism transcriptional regulator
MLPMSPTRSRGSAALLRGLGLTVRDRRTAAGLTMAKLAAMSGTSVRFVAQLEAGDANVTVVRLADVARALGVTPAELLAARGDAPGTVLALVGMRGAGKSTLGRRVAEQLAIPFVELDALVERAAGMRLAAIFELHGEPYYRRIEREVLRAFLDRTRDAVLATGGSLVMDPETWALLRARAATVWLRARAEDHWARVVSQGDVRPMATRNDALGELRAILRAREPLYAEARYTVDTSALSVEQAAQALCDLSPTGT